MSTSNIIIFLKYFNSFVSNVTDVFKSEFDTHDLISETCINFNFKLIASDESMIFSIITFHEIVIIAA